MFLSYSRVVRQAVLDRLSLPVDVALDVGCGTGNVVKSIVDLCGSVTGLDTDCKLVEVARARLAAHTNVAFLCGAFDGWKPVISAFDLITCEMSFHHFGTIESAIKLRSLIKPGGSLIILDYVTDQHSFTTRYCLDLLSVPFAGPRSVLPALGRFGTLSFVELIIGRIGALLSAGGRQHIRSDLHNQRAIPNSLLRRLQSEVFLGSSITWMPGSIFLLEYSSPQ